MATQKEKERPAAPRKPGTKADATIGPTPQDQAREMPASPASHRGPPVEQRVEQRVEHRVEKRAPDDIRRRIETAAYLRAKQRGFAPGYELDDWLKAEAEVKNRLQP